VIEVEGHVAERAGGDRIDTMRLARVCSALLAASCGRFAFDSSATADSTTADDAATARYPGPFEGLLLWYPMDDDPANGAADATSNARHATCVGGCPTLAPGRIGHAFDFTGNIHLQLLNDPGLDGLTSFTVAFRSSLRAFGGDGISKAVGTDDGDSFELGVTAGGVAVMCTTPDFTSLANCDGSVPGVVSLNRWVHLASTWDGTTVRVFLDGAQVAIGVARTTAFDAHAVLIGAEETPKSGNVAYHLDGLLDDVRLYDRALSTVEIAELGAPGP
jgi:hypothetical protein